MAKKPRILCIEMGTGKGGASRSLFFSIAHMDRSAVDVTVWGRENNPIAEMYREIGVQFVAVPNQPSFRAMPNTLKSLVDLVAGLRTWNRQREWLKNAAVEINSAFDLVHLNHERLFLLAWALRPMVKVPISMHMRTNPFNTFLSRWEMRQRSRVIDHFVYITENELETFKRLGGTEQSSSIIFNIVAPPEPIAPHMKVPQDNRLKIASLANFDWLRGTDRLVDVAAAIKKRGRSDILFISAGMSKLSKGMPGDLGKLAANDGSLEDYAKLRGVDDMILFLGHVAQPESVLVASDILVKFTREDNPWGRDIMEALAYGKPVITVGKWQTFVETGKTGIMLDPFDTDRAADDIIHFADHRNRLDEMGQIAKARIADLCNGNARAADLVNSWHNVIERGRTKP